MWNGKIANVKNFKIFGYKCFIKKNDDSLENFNPGFDEGIFLGYSTHSKSFKSYNKILSKIVEAINVVFHEISLSHNNNKEDLEEISFQKSKTLHDDENLDNVDSKIVDKIEQENCSILK